MLLLLLLLLLLPLAFELAELFEEEEGSLVVRLS